MAASWSNYESRALARLVPEGGVCWNSVDSVGVDSIRQGGNIVMFAELLIGLLLLLLLMGQAKRATNLASTIIITGWR